ARLPRTRALRVTRLRARGARARRLPLARRRVAREDPASPWRRVSDTNSCLRGNTMRRLALTLAAVALAFAPYARLAAAAGFNVNGTYDAVDAVPGDGICADAAGNCTLRAAVQEANALPGWDDISVPGGVFYLTVGGAGEDFAAKGDLDVRSELGIFG